MNEINAKCEHCGAPVRVTTSHASGSSTLRVHNSKEPVTIWINERITDAEIADSFAFSCRKCVANEEARA